MARIVNVATMNNSVA